MEVRFQKPVLLPTHVALQASESAASGQFRLIGEGDIAHMAGSWQPLTV